jgi:shikimate kinase
MTADRHLILVGLPGAGKTTIGRLVAARLGRPFVDFDSVIEEETGSTVSELFASDGEEAFRARERALTQRLVHAAPSVLSPGGGWITASETVSLIRWRAHLVWLQVGPTEAARRMGTAAALRPLLQGDPEVRVAELLRVRERYYRTADTSFDTELISPQLLVEQVVRLASQPDRAVG